MEHHKKTAHILFCNQYCEHQTYLNSIKYFKSEEFEAFLNKFPKL